MGDKVTTIEATLEHKTINKDGSPRAYLLDTGSVKDWVPASIVEDNEDGTWTMPYKTALDKGFI